MVKTINLFPPEPSMEIKSDLLNIEGDTEDAEKELEALINGKNDKSVPPEPSMEIKSDLLNIKDGPVNLVSLTQPFSRAILETVHNDMRAYHILKYYYGLEGSRTYTLQEIGDAEGITRERVRQINAKSLKIIRQALLGKEGLGQWDMPGVFFNEARALKETMEAIGDVAVEDELGFVRK